MMLKSFEEAQEAWAEQPFVPTENGKLWTPRLFTRRSLFPLALGSAAYLLSLREALATNRTAWTAGNGQGLSWGTAINSADMASMTSAQSVLSSVSDIANGTNLDQYMDLSFSLAISSSTIAVGANIAAWIYILNQDGTTYGDNQLAAGTAASKTPTFAPCMAFPLIAAASQTTLIGNNFGNPIPIPPGSFRVAMQDNSGFNLSSGTQTFKYRTYNINLNN